MLLGGCKLLFVTCAVLDPLLDALFAWLAARVLPIVVTVVIGFIVWIFGDTCEKQAREERNGKC